LRPLLLCGLLVAGIVLFALFPRFTMTSSETLARAPIKSLGLGVALFFSVPPVVLLLVITIIGIPIAIAIWFVAGLWVIYRVIRGYLVFKDSRAIPGV